jgi:mono/diheme cytochrome c family protein
MSINIQVPKCKRSFGLVGISLILVAELLGGAAAAGEVSPDGTKQVERGQMIYKKFCAVCHGENLEGQANWRIRKPDGKLPAPPHDETGHTWHHPDEVLFGITKNGLVPPHAPANYKSDMPAWGTTLKDSDIWAVLSYIKSRWPAETRKIQEEVNARAGR